VYNWTPNYAISNTTGPNVVVSPSVNTTYTLTSYNSNGTLVCSETKMMPIVVVPQVTPAIINNQSICLGNETSLAADGGNTYIWAPANSLNNASTSVVIASPSVTTIYTVDVSNNGSCGKTATVLVKVNPNPQVFAGRDTTFNLDEPMFITATGTGTLTWLSGEGIFCKDCPETKINATQSGCYVIETVNEFGCKASDEVCIEVTTNSGIFIPNSFTPNDDGLNDVFLVQGYSLSDVKLEIFDRWGEKLFSSNDQKLGWNGTYKGTACKSDVYVYKLSYKGLDGKRQFKTGHVSISR
jgi:gliding motility-associated-like protein